MAWRGPSPKLGRHTIFHMAPARRPPPAPGRGGRYGGGSPSTFTTCRYPIHRFHVPSNRSTPLISTLRFHRATHVYSADSHSLLPSTQPDVDSRDAATAEPRRRCRRTDRGLLWRGLRYPLQSTQLVRSAGRPGASRATYQLYHPASSDPAQAALLSALSTRLPPDQPAQPQPGLPAAPDTAPPVQPSAWHSLPPPSSAQPVHPITAVRPPPDTAQSAQPSAWRPGRRLLALRSPQQDILAAFYTTQPVQPSAGSSTAFFYLRSPRTSQTGRPNFRHGQPASDSPAAPALRGLRSHQIGHLAAHHHSAFTQPLGAACAAASFLRNRPLRQTQSALPLVVAQPPSATAQPAPTRDRPSGHPPPVAAHHPQPGYLADH